MDLARGLCLVGVVCVGACVDDPQGRGVEERERVANTQACADLGYTGTCLGEVSVWWEDRSCRVRDCGGEGKTCGWIADGIGFGCLEGTHGSTVFDCAEVGYEGACLSGDLLVWTEGGACRWADCRAYGLGCGWTDAVGYDCIDGRGEEPTEPDPTPPASGDLLTVSEIVGGVPYSITQDYGPTTYDYDYSYCWSYGVQWGSHEHCATDIGISYGTPLYVPGDGTVLIAGESNYFEDDTNRAAGELEIRLDRDGAEVILGHMTRIDLFTGQRVTAGQAAGLSGSQGGAHLHLEVRVPSAGGLRTVDPMMYFGG